MEAVMNNPRQVTSSSESTRLTSQPTFRIEVEGLLNPSAVCMFQDEVFVADCGNRRIFNLQTNSPLSIPIDLPSPRGLAASHSHLYVSCQHFVLRIDLRDTNGGLKRLGDACRGSSDSSDPIRFNSPSGLAVDSKGRLFVCDYGNNCVRMISKTFDSVQTVVGSPTGTKGLVNSIGPKALLDRPIDCLVYREEDVLFVSEQGNSTIRVLDLKTFEIFTFIGPEHGIKAPSGLSLATLKNDTKLLFIAEPTSNTIHGASFLFTRDPKTRELTWRVLSIRPVKAVSVDDPASSVRIHAPWGLAFDQEHARLYVSEWGPGQVRSIQFPNSKPAISVKSSESESFGASSGHVDSQLSEIETLKETLRLLRLENSILKEQLSSGSRCSNSMQTCFDFAKAFTFEVSQGLSPKDCEIETLIRDWDHETRDNVSEFMQVCLGSVLSPSSQYMEPFPEISVSFKNSFNKFSVDSMPMRSFSSRLEATDTLPSLEDLLGLYDALVKEANDSNLAISLEQSNRFRSKLERVIDSLSTPGLDEARLFCTKAMLKSIIEPLTTLVKGHSALIRTKELLRSRVESEENELKSSPNMNLEKWDSLVQDEIFVVNSISDHSSFCQVGSKAVDHEMVKIFVLCLILLVLESQTGSC
jgi:sugar lactone lactonase YvrE